jgi:hypothetical protein
LAGAVDDELYADVRLRSAALDAGTALRHGRRWSGVP